MINTNLKALVEQYKDLALTEETKLREALQVAALLGLQRHGFFEKAAFYGGTALRILYGLDRFSEDMDFTLLAPDPQFDFSPYLEGIRQELEAFGLEVTISQKEKRVETSVSSAFLKTNTLKLYLTLGDEESARKVNHNEKVHIKLEVDTDPPLNFRVENRVVVSPTAFYVLTLHLNDLFAGKMHAALYRAWKGRIKGRDWYDVAWYIQRGTPLNLAHLNERIAHNKDREGEPFSRESLMKMLKSKIAGIDWELAKADVKPFILEPKRLDIWSADYFTQLVDHLKFEN